MRQIILHYHLFKNAGTSLDQILKQNFPRQWVTAEFPANGGSNTALVEEWIASESDAVAFSSHTMLGSIPQIDGVKIIPVILLRDPIKRIESAYKFERKQVSESLGAKLAKEHDFGGYVRTRLANPNDRQCRNFHTSRFAMLAPGPEPEVERAIKAAKHINNVGVLGQVEKFDDALVRLRQKVAETKPAFAWQEVHANTTGKQKMDADNDLLELLNLANSDDYTLMRVVENLLRDQPQEAGKV